MRHRRRGIGADGDSRSRGAIGIIFAMTHVGFGVKDVLGAAERGRGMIREAF